MALVSTSAKGAGSSGSGNRVAIATITAVSTSATGTTFGTGTTLCTCAPFTADGTSVYLVEFFCGVLKNSSTSNSTLVDLADGGTQSSNLITSDVLPSTAMNYPTTGRVYLTLSAGSHTLSAVMYVNAGTGFVIGGPGGAGNRSPAYLAVTKVT